MHSGVGVAVVVALVGCGGAGDSGGDPWDSFGTGDGTGGGDVCSSSVHDDDMQLDAQSRVEVDGEVRRTASIGDVAVLCGVGFVQAYDASTADVGAAVSLPGACSGIAAIDEATVVVSTDDGALIRLIRDDLTLSTESSIDVGVPLGGVAVDESTVWAAATDAGVLGFDATTLAGTHEASVADARDVAVADGGILVAAGDEGVVHLSRDGSRIDTASTASAATGIRARGKAAVVLRGAQGWDLLTLDDNEASIVASIPTRGVVVDAAFVGEEVLTIEGHAVVRHDLSGGEPGRVSIEHRPSRSAMDEPWLRAIAIGADDTVVVADDAAAMPLRLYPAAVSPQVSVDVPSLAVWTDAGTSTEAIYLVKNEGTAPLLLRDVDVAAPFSAQLDTTTLPESAQCPGQHVVEPGATALIEIAFSPDDAQAVEQTLSIHTDDPDEPTVEIGLDGNRPGPTPGDPADDFSLLTLDGERVRLSDYRGRVVFLKLFNFGCSTCAKEFPEIEAQLLPDYGPSDLAVIGINTTHRTAYADSLRTDKGLTLPIALDIDSEVFRRYRAPKKVFPLHVVIDRDGTIAHVDNEPGVPAIRAAIDSALEP